MSTAEMDVTCPKCGNEEANECFNNRTHISETFCFQCGYWHEKNYQTGAESSKGGFGSFRMTYLNGISSFGVLPGPTTLKVLKRDFRRTLRSLGVKHLEFSLKDGDVWKAVVVKDFPRATRGKICKPKKQVLPDGSLAPLVFEDFPEDILF